MAIIESNSINRNLKKSDNLGPIFLKMVFLVQSRKNEHCNKICIFELVYVSNFTLIEFCAKFARYFLSSTEKLDSVIEFRLLELVYNHFHNILRLFDISANFAFTTGETMRDYYL